MRKYSLINREKTLDIVRDLCHIPAPSFGERGRAEYCKAWLEGIGAKGVYIDKVNNVIFPYNCEGSQEMTVIAAHTDTVFPDTESYPEYKEDEKCIYCPGVGDDTASVAVLMMTAKYLIENNIKPENGILFVCNSCEEGLGNLVGIRQLMKDFGDRVKQFITFDATIGKYTYISVGSHRYEVEVRTEGGHSYGKFGNKNAIHALSEIITEIYSIDIPRKDGAKTTLNVGSIEGGTSVNTIAQNAKMLCEYRSNDRECLEIMRQNFMRIFEGAKNENVQVIVKTVGERPCKGEVNTVIEKKLIDSYANAVKMTVGDDVVASLSSTDANIPMSMGIASICVGVHQNFGTSHRREEYLEKESVVSGLEIAIRMVLEFL